MKEIISLNIALLIIGNNREITEITNNKISCKICFQQFWSLNASIEYSII